MRLCVCVFLLILSLIYTRFRMSHLTSVLNEFKKVPCFFRVLSAPTGVIFKETNSDTTKTMTNHTNKTFI